MHTYTGTLSWDIDQIAEALYLSREDAKAYMVGSGRSFDKLKAVEGFICLRHYTVPFDSLMDH